MSRKQSYVCTDTCSVIFDGAKSFWKTRTNLDVLIVEHPKQMCLELIVYNANIGVEAERIYISTLLIGSKLDQEELKSKVAEKKEALTRAKKTFKEAELTKEVSQSMISQYLLARLGIPNDLPSGTLTVILMPLTGDKIVDIDTQRLDILCEKPNLLQPLVVARQKTVQAGEFQKALDNLKAESANLARETNMAELATLGVEGFKQMLAEKMKMELEMRRRMSAPRLRWVKAINRVLIQNYIEKVKIRLETLEREAAYRAEIAAANGEGKKKTRKLLRKSVDNSDLTKLPSLRISAPENQLHEGMSDTEQEIAGSSKSQRLPKVSQMTVIAERRRARAAAGGVGSEKTSSSLRVPSTDKEGNSTNSAKIARTSMTRRSFGNEMYPSLSEAQMGLGSSSNEINDTPPSLKQSYHSASSKLLTPLVPNQSSKEGSSIRLVKNIA